MKSDTPICDASIKEMHELEGIACVSPYVAKKLEKENREMREVLVLAAESLTDLGACDDPDCDDANCNHALPKIQELLERNET